MQNSQKLLIDKRNEIREIVEKYSQEYLNNEYLQLAIILCDKLFNAHGEKLLKGKSSSWACGIIHAIGVEKGLFIKNSEPYVKACDLYKVLGVSSSTGLSKSKEIKLLVGNIIDTTNKKSKDNFINNAKTHDIINDENFIKAQELIKEAWNAKNFKKKVNNAKKALNICDYCSDAYILLAKDNNISPLEKEALYRKALGASLKLLGVKSLGDIPETLWKTTDIEPLLGAKYKLASQLWINDKREEAILNLNEILEHDLNDRLMIRSILINWLLLEEKLEESSVLLNRFDNDYLTAIQFSKVILKYKEGNLQRASQLLKRATRINPHVIKYVLKQKRIPNVLPHIKRFGSDEEAMHYIKNGLVVWQQTDGLLNWLKENKKDLVL